MHHDLRVRALDAAAFSPYGDLLALKTPGNRAINAGTSQRLDLPDTLDLNAEGGHPLLAVFHARAQAARGPWHVLERHRLGSQTFIPLAGARCVLLVALGATRPEPHTLAAFAVRGDQGFTLRAGTWHHPLIALDAGDFLVLERAAAREDCEVVHLDTPVRLRRP